MASGGAVLDDTVNSDCKRAQHLHVQKIAYAGRKNRNALPERRRCLTRLGVGRLYVNVLSGLKIGGTSYQRALGQVLISSRVLQRALDGLTSWSIGELWARFYMRRKLMHLYILTMGASEWVRTA